MHGVTSNMSEKKENNGKCAQLFVKYFFCF